MWLLWIFFLSSFNSFCMDDSCFYFVTPRLCKSIVINLLGFLLLLSGWLFCHAACRILVLYQGSNLCPLQWSASLTTGLPGKSLACLLTKQKPCLDEVKKQQQQPKPLCFVILTIFTHTNFTYTMYTWDNLAAHGDRLEGFSRWLRVRNLTLWHNFAARCYWLKSWIAMRTKGNLLGCCHFGRCSFQWWWQRIKCSVSLSFSVGWESFLKWKRQINHQSIWNFLSFQQLCKPFTSSKINRVDRYLIPLYIFWGEM